MRKIQIVELKVLVPTGTPAELAGNFPRYLGGSGINTDQFTPKPTDPELWRSRQGISAWLTEPVEKEIWLVSYTGEHFPSYEPVYDRLLSDGYPLTNFPELCAIKRKAGELWGMGVRAAVSTSPDSFWRDRGGVLRVPYMDCRPGYRGLDTHWVGGGWNDDDWFVVGGK